jgi:hypothetical protein
MNDLLTVNNTPLMLPLRDAVGNSHLLEAMPDWKGAEVISAKNCISVGLSYDTIRAIQLCIRKYNLLLFTVSYIF